MVSVLTMPRSLLFVPLALVAAQVWAADPLVWKWSEGEAVRYHMTQSMGMQMDAGPAGKIESSTDQAMLLRWTVDSVQEDGDAVIRQATKRVVMKTTGPQGRGFQYDTDDEEPPLGLAAMVAPMLNAMVSAPFTVSMASNGEVTDVQLTEELATAFKRLPGGALSADMVSQLAHQCSAPLPEEELEVGMSWSHTLEVKAPQVGKMQVVNTYTYQGPREVDGKTLEAFSVTSEISPLPSKSNILEISISTRESSGELLFDREAGKIDRSSLTQLMDVGVTISGPAGAKTVTNQVSQTIELRRLADSEKPDLGALLADVDESMGAPAPSP